jgi:hypothetical protein
MSYNNIKYYVDLKLNRNINSNPYDYLYWVYVNM